MRESLDQARQLFTGLPLEDVGCLYLEAAGRPICPDPDAPEFARLTRHFGSPRGAVPRIAEG